MRIHVQTRQKYFVRNSFIRESVVTDANVDIAHNRLVTLHFDNTLVVSYMKLDIQAEQVQIATRFTVSVLDGLKIMSAGPIEHGKVCMYK